MLTSLNSVSHMSVSDSPLEITKDSIPTVDVNNLLFSWKKTEETILDISCFTVQRGEKVFLEGPSGSGKSTFLSILAGVSEATSGRISLLGQNLETLRGSGRDSFRADHIGVIFQMFNLLPYLSVIENVVLPCLFSHHRKERVLSSGNVPDEEAIRILGRLGIAPPLFKKKVTELSVGQQQRVAAARALLGQPEIIIADEPTSSLDEANRQSFLDILFEECRRSKSSLIFASHDRALAHLFDRTVRLEEINQAGTASATQKAEAN